jgi:tetratricopeptide (TPR) repeat protein
MTEQTIKQPMKKVIPLWKASSILVVWVLIVGSIGMFVGNRYFWSEVDVRRVEREIAHYRQLAELEPENPEHLVALGFNFHRLNDTQSAISNLNAAIQLDDQYFDAYLNLGYVYTDLNYWDDALVAFEKCVEISPEDYKGQFNLGIVYRELNMIDASYDALHKALDLRPGATDVIYHLALTAEREGNNESAIHYLEQTLAFDPRYAEALSLYKKLTQ